jgi:glycosyltransferase involved in cell wall biosynthesis
VHPDRVNEVFSEHHVFLFPTRGENFGHVILEAFAAGCPVLLSDQTMWRNLTEKRVGWDLSLSDMGGFRDAMHKCIEMDATEYLAWSNSAFAYAKAFDADQGKSVLESYRRLFLRAINP